MPCISIQMYLVLFFEHRFCRHCWRGREGNAEDFNLYYKTGFMNMQLNENQKHLIQNIEKPLNFCLLIKIEQLCS
jgi:hypothetical protein